MGTHERIFSYWGSEGLPEGHPPRPQSGTVNHTIGECFLITPGIDFLIRKLCETFPLDDGICKSWPLKYSAQRS